METVRMRDSLEHNLASGAQQAAPLRISALPAAPTKKRSAATGSYRTKFVR